MPMFERDGASLYWEEHGSGFPILLFAPGGMRSSVGFWVEGSPFDPRVELSGDFRVIAMDQRNAGRSMAPIEASDGWHRYTEDHLALLDHLEIERCHVMGGCIGSSYCLGVLEAAPGRVAAAVLQNPIGLHENRDAFFAMFDSWADPLRESRVELEDAILHPFRERMYGSDFVFNVSRDVVRGCAAPLLILAGSDLYHPAPIAREIADLAPNAELVLDWKAPDQVPATIEKVLSFLQTNTPVT